jgi:lysozyme
VTSRAKVLSAAVLALVAAGATGVQIARQFLTEKEGLELAAYQDGARVWTICQGKTEGVGPHSVATKDVCDEWFDGEIGRRMRAVNDMIEVPISEPARAGITSFCFNVGIGACKRSTLIREINRGNRVHACDSILRWKYITRDGVKYDCFEDMKGVCSGLKDRRYGERALCLMQ